MILPFGLGAPALGGPTLGKGFSQGNGGTETPGTVKKDDPGSLMI